MKKIIILYLLLSLFYIGYTYAAATQETGDSRAKPIVAYGKTSGGTLVPILLDNDGIIQIS